MDRHFQHAILAAELNQVHAERSKLTGVVVLPRADACLGPFEPGPFKFRMILPDDFPWSLAAPVVRFQSSVFHPSVDPITNELNLGSSFKIWRSPWATSEGSLHERRGEGGDAASDERDWLWHILLHVKHLFNVPATIVKLDDATTVNHTAANLLKSDAGLFALKASESVRESGTELYGSEADDFGIRFGRWQKDLHGSGLNAVLSSSYNQEEDDPKAGLSWAASGLSFVRGSE